MTAFILFVLATEDVKGFAFTLGIGTFVSLFTAVMATQAILMTLGGSRAISHPSLLGAAGSKRRWRFDFMGASRYFFSMSGVILLVGALAIGGRGLNLGIDFTSGTQISVGLDRPATVAQIKTVMASVKQADATVQKVSGDKALGDYGFQIQSKSLSQTQAQKVESELQAGYGIRTGPSNSPDFNNTTIGATFGSTVAHSAVVAIIVSLLVISIYITLRFDWKFAVPVLIALMHDLLITSGVYALTGRVVTVDTVAALLTILGYSMYDTIIVFDRVRENIPRMPRAAFSQIVNRSMSEVLTRSLATTSCTLLPVIALLIFGGSTLKDFAFALLIGVASGAYSSIFIASPVLTHWKERENGYRARRARITNELGHIPAYAEGADIEPVAARARLQGRLTTPDLEQTVSAAEFEQMKRDLGLEQEPLTGRTSTLTKRTAHQHQDNEPTTPPQPQPRPTKPRQPNPRQPPSRQTRTQPPTDHTPTPDPTQHQPPTTNPTPPNQPAHPNGPHAPTADTGDAADGHARLGDDGPRAVALHDLAARPPLGRDRRSVHRRPDRLRGVRSHRQRLLDSRTARNPSRNRCRSDSGNLDRDRSRLSRRRAPRTARASRRRRPHLVGH